MRSPFAIFRKHQKILMVLLTGMALFAFVVLDNLRSDRSEGFIPILCSIVGAGAFALFARKSGDTIKYGVIGAVAGAAIGFFIPKGNGPKPAVQTDAGNLNQVELHNLVVRRQNANNFLRFAFEKVSPPMNNNPMLQQWWMQQLNSRLFGFGRDQQDLTDDVVLGFLLDKEADDLGIVVSDGAVSDYINRMTNKRLKASDFTEILKRLHLGESQLFDAIRGELRAKLAMEMLMPRTTPTPGEYWEQYKKLGVMETLEVAGVPVEDFLPLAPKPTEEKLTAFFDQWKTQPSGSKGSPGLYQPRRVRVEYLEAEYLATETEVAAKPITDAEVKQYYDDHHEEYRNRAAMPSPPPPIKPIRAPG